jgi:hypothetical protein
VLPLSHRFHYGYPWVVEVLLGTRLVKLRSGGLQHDFIDVAPDPVLIRLKRLNYRMVGRVEVLGGVLVLGGVTAAYVSTGETEAQMHPCITSLQTVLAAIGAWRDLLYLIEMRTAFGHNAFLPFFCSS